MTEKEIEDLLEWDKNKVVAQEILSNGKYLSTVSLFPPVSFAGAREEFETMLFDDKESLNDLGCWRRNSKEEALKGHKEIVEEQRLEELTIKLSGLE